MKKIRFRKRFYLIITSLVILVAICAFLLVKLMGEDNPPTAQEKPEPIEISITCAGDIVLHDPNIKSAYDAATDTYNFDEPFAYIKPYIESADLALCTIETTFPGKPYTGYPMFRGPDALATSLKSAGFDMIMTSSNHAYDSGMTGITKTVEVLRANDLIAAGTRLSPEEPRYAMSKVKGVKIAMIAYTYETGSGSDSITYLNANPLTDEAAALVNSFNYGKMVEDVAEMKSIADEARTAGADIILMYFHWGEEYQLTPNGYQTDLAQQVAEQVDADIIFASHPHVPQTASVITVTKEAADGTMTEKKVPVFYALGNFLSNQRRELIPSGGRYVEEGYLAQTKVTYDPDKKVIQSIDTTTLPYWVDKYTADGKIKYAIVPLDAGFEQNQALAKSGHLSLAQTALTDIRGILGTEE
jgi:poly-gamma-glutamate capsule biosynthesis protein CapA/YwtB (metallophosphatase superfamily)